MPIQHPAGPSGGYVFADLAQLDSVITQWQTFHDGIRKDAQDISDAAQVHLAPAEDRPSVTQADATRRFLRAGLGHNDAMQNYTKSYLDRLIATRAQYAADDDGNADRLRNVAAD